MADEGLKPIGVEFYARGDDVFFRVLSEGNTALRKFGDGAEDNAKKATSAWDRMVNGAQEHIGHKLVDSFWSAGGAVADFFVGSIDKAAEFEGTMLRFGAAAGEGITEAGKSIDDFSDKFLQLGKDTAFSAQEAGDAAIELAKGGRSAGQVYDELADTLNLAAAGGLELATAAEISANQMAVWGNTGVTATDVADRMAQAANASTDSVEGLAQGLANVGGVAKVAGLSFDETVTTLAAIRSGFSSSADAGTSLKTMLNNLQPDTQDEIDAFRELGLLTEQGTSKFYDAQGAFVGMQEATRLLHDATLDLTEADKSRLLMMAFGSDAQRAAAALAEQGAEGYLQMAENMGKAGSAAEQAGKMNQGYAQMVKALQGSLETLQITLGQKVLPFLTDMVVVITDGVNVVLEMVDSIGGLTPALGSLATIVAIYGAKQLPDMVKGLRESTTEFWNQKKAAGFSMLAIDGMAAAVGLAIYKQQEFNRAVEEGTKKLLESRQWWQSSATALELYAGSSEYVRTKTKPLADELQRLRDRQEEVTRAFASSYKDLDKDEIAAFTNEQNRLANEIKRVDGALRGQIVQARHNAPLMKQGIADSYGLAHGYDAFSQALTRTVRAAGPANTQLEELGKELEKINEAGITALAGALNDQIAFFSDSEQRTADYHTKLNELNTAYHDVSNKAKEGWTQAQIKAEQDRISQEIKDTEAGYTDQNIKAAVFYEKQKAMRQAAYGEQLLDFVINQNKLGAISDEKAAALLGEITKQYGITADSASVLWGKQTESILKWADSGTQSADRFVLDMRKGQTAAATFEAELDQRVGLAIANLYDMQESGKITATEFDRALGTIRSEVRTKMITETQTGHHDILEYNYALENIPKDVTTTAKVKAGDTSKDAIAIGYAISSGMADGVAKGSTLIAGAMNDAIGAAYASAASRYGIHSPSRWFAQHLGLPISQGVGWGIDMGMPSVESALIGGLEGIYTGAGGLLRGEGPALAGAISGGIDQASGAGVRAIGQMDTALTSRAEDMIERLQAIYAQAGAGNWGLMPTGGAPSGEPEGWTFNPNGVQLGGGTAALSSPAITPPATPSQIIAGAQTTYNHAPTLNYSATYNNTPPQPARDSAHAAALASML